MDIHWLISLIAGFVVGWNVDDVLVSKDGTKRQRVAFWIAIVVWLGCTAYGLRNHF